MASTNHHHYRHHHRTATIGLTVLTLATLILFVWLIATLAADAF